MIRLKIIPAILIWVALFSGCGKNSDTATQTANPPVDSSNPDQAISPPPSSAKELAPDFTLPDINGNPVSLKDFRGQTVLLVFWGSRCPICMEEVPELEKIEEEYRGKKFKLITINANIAIDKTKKFAAAKGMKYLVLVDHPDYQATRAYKVQFFPLAKFVIDPEGYLQSSGELNTVRPRLAELLK